MRQFWPQLLEELGHLRFQRRDAPILLGDDRIFLRELGFELRNPIVSPVTLHLPRTIELPADGKNFRIYGAKRITYAVTRDAFAAPGREGLNGHGGASHAVNL